VLIHGNYLSQKDIEICLGFDLESLVTEADHKNMRDLDEVLRARYGSDNTGGAVQ